MDGSAWARRVRASERAQRTTNPIRAIVDGMKTAPHPDKPMISLSIGDPTLFGNFKAPAELVDKLADNMRSYKYNGYPPAHGYETARAAVAQAYTLPEAPLTAKDVIIASGCSGAIEIAMSGLASPGQNILLPRPGFSLYETLANSFGWEVRFYDLLPNREWEIDLEQVDKLVDDKTAFILINNPSNPCGSVFSEQHLRDILKVAEKHCLPIISDEIYADMVFSGKTFIPLAKLSTTVPILSTGGIAKRWMVPGWRVGWILIHDRQGIFAKEVTDGLVRLSQCILGSNSLIQSILPDMLLHTSDSYYKECLTQLEGNAMYTCDRLSKVPGLRVIVPSGAMYVMVGIDKKAFKDITSDTDFCAKLVQEQSVFCLPGSCFRGPDFFRIVFTPPKEQLTIACDRIEAFCHDHAL